jgi:hypothetical protein
MENHHEIIRCFPYPFSIIIIVYIIIIIVCHRLKIDRVSIAFRLKIDRVSLFLVSVVIYYS